MTNYAQDANCQLAWLFKEGSGTSVADSSQNSNNGSFKASGEPAWASSSPPISNISDYVEFDGSDDKIIAADDDTLDGFSAVGIVAYVYCESQTSEISFIAKHHATDGYRTYFLAHESDNKIRFGIDTGGGMAYADSSVAINNSEWVHLGATWNGSTMYVYINGVERGSGSKSGTMNANGNPMTIGCRFKSAYEQFLYGKMCDVGLFDRYITSTEINDMMDNAIDGGSGSSYQKELMESVSLTDVQNKSTGRSLSESMGLSDNVPKSTTRNVQESVSLTDALLKGGTRVLSEQVTLSDTRTASIGRIASEIISLADSLPRSIARTVSETMSLSDIAEGTKVVIKELTELVSLSDGLTRGITRLVSESITLDDSTLKDLSRALSETISLTDALTNLLSRVLSETVTLSDSAEKGLVRQLVEQVILIDTCPKLTLRNLAELCTLADTLTSALVSLINIIRVVSESVSEPGMTGEELSGASCETEDLNEPAFSDESIIA